MILEGIVFLGALVVLRQLYGYVSENLLSGRQGR